MKNVTRLLRTLAVLTALLFTTGVWAQTTILSEGFESGSLPTGWTENFVYGTTSWTYPNGGPSGYPAAAHSGVHNANLNYNGHYVKTELITPVMNLGGYASATVTFWQAHAYWSPDQDSLTVLYRNAPGPWTMIAIYQNNLTDWTQTVLNIPNISSTTQINFRGCANYGYGVELDDILVEAIGYGDITGTVINSITLDPVGGATISVPGYGSATANSSGVYTLTGVGAGPRAVTASAPLYINQTKNITVIANQIVTLNFALDPETANISGIVTNASTGQPLIGAKVWATGGPGTVPPTYSLSDGSYTLKLYPGGTYAIHCDKWGFSQIDVAPAAYAVNNNYTQNFALVEQPNSPTTMTAALNSGQTAVNLNWTLPTGYYLRVYDDGIAENFTIWSAEGNMNAVKFSALGAPYRVHGCQINIGTSENYTGNPFVPFQVAVYDASGPGGKPGTMIGGPYDVTAANFGWNEFLFPEDVIVNSGDFYVVQIQGGNAPDASGVAIDTTTQQVRSYQRFVTGGGPWLLASGNFMMRAIIRGTGGPLLMPTQPVTLSGGGPIEGAIYANRPGTVVGTEGFGPESPTVIINYQYWRLHQGEEATPGVWNSVGVTTGLTGTDNSWPTLPDGPYRWAVETQYTGAIWSPPTFSNVIGKNWTTTATVNVTLSCDSASINNTVVTLVNNPFDSTYTATLSGTGNTGSASFSNVWKGNYDLTVYKYGYTVYTQAVSIMSPSTIDVFVLQIKTPPTGMAVDDRSLLANWYPPNPEVTMFSEDFSSGSFSTNNWTVDGANWGVTGAFGNPAPSAEFSDSPSQTNYSLSITSKTLTGLHSPRLLLSWDIYLDNFGTTAVNYMSVELWNGTSWVELKTYENTASIPWTHGIADISSVTNSDFQFRFNAHGDDNYYINAWYVDNIKVIAADVEGKNPCILGYNFYLNSALVAVVPDTFYYIPPALVTYGQTYTACAEAIYGSGYSTQTCATFTSHFLCPPTALAGQPLDDVVYLTWTKPSCMGGTMMDFCYDDGTMEIGFDIIAGAVAWLGNYFPIDPTISGDLKSFDLYFSLNSGGTYYLTIDVFDATGTTILGSSDPFLVPTDAWINVEVPDISITGPFYAMAKWDALSGASNWFGEDQDGPYAADNLAYYYDTSLGFMTLSDASGYPPGVFLECAHLLAYGDKKETVLIPGHINKVPPAVTGKPSTLAHMTMPSTPAPHITPASPAANDGQIGYNVYRDETFIAYVDGPNTLEYYDLGLNPGNYCYTVTAKYDLTVYGFPGQFGESLGSNKACVLVNYGYELPFYEPWDQGTFDFQSWTFAPTQGNWSMNTAVGNPQPSADFSWQPMITNYDLSLVSPTINAAGWTCADLWLDFDVKLVDRNATSAEFLDVEVYYNNNWFNKLELTNNGSIDWTTQHIDIHAVAGKAFKVRFRANGANSSDILHWYIDNVHIYGVCHPATALAGSQAQFATTLTWTAPECAAGSSGVPMQFIFDDGTWENGYRGLLDDVYRGNLFPIASTLSGVLQSFDMYWIDNGSGSAQTLVLEVFDGAQNPVGSTDPFTVSTIDEWINVLAPDIPFTGQFYAMVHWQTLPNYSYFLGTDEDGPYSSQDLEWYMTGGAWSHNTGGVPCVYLQRANALVGADLKMVQLTPTSMRPIGPVLTNTDPMAKAGTHGDSGNHNIMGPVGGSTLDSTSILGYNVWRADNSATGPFNMVGTATTTTFVDNHPATTEPNQDFYYFIESPMVRSYDGVAICAPHSDTIVVHFPAVGINEPGNSNISVYPNPANDVVNVTSTSDIRTIEVLNYIGQLVYTNKSANGKKMQLNVSTMQSGVYFVKVTTTDGLKTVKITVTH